MPFAAVDLNFKATRTQQFNLMLEKEFGGNVVSVGYIGTRSDRAVGGNLGAGGANYNLAPLGPGNVQTRRPFFSTLPGVTNLTVRESKSPPVVRRAAGGVPTALSRGAQSGRALHVRRR